MSTENGDNQALKHQDLVFILAIAGRIDAQARIFAKELDKSRHVYYAYSVLDSLSSSYSMFKYFFDICIGGDADDMHDLMMTPGGIAAVAAETIFMVGFSFLACHYDGEKEDTYKKWIASAWPYFRDVMKGLKNAYKGWRSTVVAMSFMGNVDLKYLIGPVGLALGLFAAANRFLLRYLVEARKVMMSKNTELLFEIKKLTSLTRQERQFYLDRIQYQSNSSRYLAFAGGAAGGLVDGLYLYVGVLALTALAPPLFIAMAAICAFYTLTCVITRLYEEYDFQLRLFITQTRCKLVLTTKEMETSYAQFLLLQEKADKSEDDLIALKNLKRELCELIVQFDAERQLLQQQSSRTYLSAGLLGIKNGLYAYGALASVLFFVSGFLVLGGVTFPPALIAVIITMGLVFMAGFLIHSLIENRKHINEQKKQEDTPYLQLAEVKQTLEAAEEKEKAQLLDKDEFHQSVKDGLTIKPAPQNFFQEWFEVCRSLFSGLGKGQKFVDFAGNPLQEADSDGHYHDTPVMYILGALSAIFFGFTLAFRALARGLGRPALGQVALTSDEPEPAVVKQEEPSPDDNYVDTSTSEPLKTKTSGGSIQPTKPRTDSLPRNDSLLSLFGLFKQPAAKKSPPLSGLHNEISDPYANQESTAPGLG